MRNPPHPGGIVQVVSVSIHSRLSVTEAAKGLNGGCAFDNITPRIFPTLKVVRKSA